MNEIIDEIISQNLIRPVDEFCSRGGKNIRAKLVGIGFNLTFESDPGVTSEKIFQAGKIVEAIHNGSLIVDDVQDGSRTRRSAPSLHLLHGVPLAINAGNWLYFRALGEIRELNLDPLVEISLIQDVINSMMKAHTGQAIDLGTKMDEVPRESVSSICQISMELKTGVLMALAMRMGSAIAYAETEIPKITETAVRIGVFLQMLDDSENLFGDSDKKFEDIVNRRPTWIWSVAAQMENYQDFLNVSQDMDELIIWMEKENFESIVSRETEKEKNFLISWLQENWGSTHPETLNEIFNMIHYLEKSYESH